jgi:hypothetical protein
LTLMMSASPVRSAGAVTARSLYVLFSFFTLASSLLVSGRTCEPCDEDVRDWTGNYAAMEWKMIGWLGLACMVLAAAAAIDSAAGRRKAADWLLAGQTLATVWLGWLVLQSGDEFVLCCALLACALGLMMVLAGAGRSRPRTHRLAAAGR